MAELADLPLVLPAPPSVHTRHALHLFMVLVTDNTPMDRDRLLDRLVREGIGTGGHYLALPEHPYYRERFGWAPEDVPAATSIGRRTLSLPLSGKLTDDDVTDVIVALRRVLAG